MRSLIVAALAVLAATPAFGAVPANAPSLPRTPDGHPDFQGVVWTMPYMATVESFPTVSPELVLSEDKAQAAFKRITALVLTTPNFKIDAESDALFTDSKGFPLVRGERHTRLLVQPPDGRLPFTPEARREAAASQAPDNKFDNPEDRPPGERCLDNGSMPPVAVTSFLHDRQFVQTPGFVAIQVEYGDEVRVIPFASEHGPAALSPDKGDSIARWEGETLVVETTNFPAWSRVRPFPVSLIVNPDANVIERFTRVSADELLYQFTVVDPKVYTAPWLAEYSMYRADHRMFPSGCHEGNYSLPNILSAARQAEATAAQKKVQAAPKSP